MIRVAYIGASHWHLRLYLDPVLKMDDAEVVGVSDPSEESASTIAARLGCESSTDYRELCERLEPDFVFALGRHCDMAGEAEFLIDNRIPFAMEKPCGLNATEVEDMARKSAEADTFAAVPLVFRQSDLVAEIQARSSASDYRYLSFKFISKPATHYLDDGCSWMLDKDKAGGGALINVGFHFIDLLQFLMPGAEVDVIDAVIASNAYHYSIEDYALVTLRVGEAIASVETGYIYPASHRYMDMHYSVYTPDFYYVVTEQNLLEITPSDGSLTKLELGTTNAPYYGRFIEDAFHRVANGAPPVASLFDAASSLRILDRVYEIAGTGLDAR